MPAARALVSIRSRGGDAGLIKKTLCDAACSGRAFGLPQWADELIDAFRQVDAEGAVL